MSNFESPRVFQANPSALKKRIFLCAGLAGLASIAWAALVRDKSGNEPFFFAGGITAVVFSLRFYMMQIKNGPARLTFAVGGITLANKTRTRVVAWPDLEAIRHMAGRGGHHWEIKPRAGATLDFYLDGLPHRQQEELREVITSIAMPNVRIVPFYNPLDRAA